MAATDRLVVTSEVQLAEQAGHPGRQVETLCLAAWLLAQHRWRGANELTIGISARAGELGHVRSFAMPADATVVDWLARVDQTLAMPASRLAPLSDFESCWLQADESAVDLSLAALAPAAPLTITLAAASAGQPYPRLVASFPPSMMEAPQAQAARNDSAFR